MFRYHEDLSLRFATLNSQSIPSDWHSGWTNLQSGGDEGVA